MRLYIIRHADPDYENNTITPDGHLEAQALAKRLAAHGFDRIFCSPMGRARHTMQYTADKLGMKADILDWTQELSMLKKPRNKWGEICAWDIPGEAILSLKPLPTHEDWYSLECYKGEKMEKVFKSIVKNSDKFLTSLGYHRKGRKYRCIKPNDKKIAVFCHGGFGLTWLAHLLQIPVPIMWSSFWMPPSSVTTILFDQRSPKWATPRCIGFGDVSHLYEAGLPVKPRGIKANFY